MSVQRTDQAMAAAAAEILGDHVNDELRARMRQLPSRLRGSGLAATYVFLMARSQTDDDLGRAYRHLTQQIADYTVEAKLLGEKTPSRLRPEEFLRHVSGASLTNYARLSAEVDLLAGWLSRLADALHTPGPGSGR